MGRRLARLRTLSTVFQTAMIVMLLPMLMNMMMMMMMMMAMTMAMTMELRGLDTLGFISDFFFYK